MKILDFTPQPPATPGKFELWGTHQSNTEAARHVKITKRRKGRLEMGLNVSIFIETFGDILKFQNFQNFQKSNVSFCERNEVLL